MLKIHAKTLDAVRVLCLEGQIINGDTEILHQVMPLAADSGEVILDLSNVTIVDAHGLGMLLQLREEALAKGTNLELVNLSNALHRIFEITKLDTVFEISSGVQFLPEIAYAARVPVAA